MDQELKRQDLIVENGQIIINGNKEKYNILLLDIIGENSWKQKMWIHPDINLT
jgi:hypothetical protein